MAQFPALPIWTDAFIADTLDLTVEEIGLYFLMLMLAWRRSDCALPDDMAWLKKSLHNRIHGHSFNTMVPKILKRFWVQTDAKWVQKRLQKEFKYASNRSQIGRKAALERWNNKDLVDAVALPAGNTPIPIPIPIKKESSYICPEDFKPSEKNYALGAKHGFDHEDVDEIAAIMVDWSHGGANKRSKWNSVLNTFIRRQTGKPKRLNPSKPTQTPLVFVREDTPQWHAWEKHLGKRLPSKNFGWWLPSEWPPEKTHQ